jgi:beta-lactamase superfamily II metal-dependent hydrolase
MDTSQPTTEPTTPGSPGITVRMLPAGHGDALVVEWDGLPAGATGRGRVVVDAGPVGTFTGLATDLRGPEGAATDLFVITHVDGDHIEGALRLLNDRGLAFTPGEVWFNAARHLVDEMGPAQGEVVSALIAGRDLAWNAAFDGQAVAAPADDAFPVRELAGGVTATVLAPGPAQLRRLRDVWEVTCVKAGIGFDDPEAALAHLESRRSASALDTFLGGDWEPDVASLLREAPGDDGSVANASSIVLLLERGDDRVLLTGDTTLGVLEPAVRRLLAQRGVGELPLTTFKVPHHGSRNNLSRELVSLLPAQRYLISTDGGHHGHPDDAAIARILASGPPGLELVFNYDSPRNRRWEDAELVAQFGHRVRFDPGVPARERRPRRRRG